MAFPFDWHKDLIINFAKSISTNERFEITGKESFKVHYLIDEKIESYKKKSKVESVEDCIPLICIHTGIFLMQEGKKAKSKVYFDELLKKNFSSHRIKEL